MGILVILVTSDLLFRSKIAEAVRSAGHDFQAVRSEAALQEALNRSEGKIVFVDLHLTSFDPIAAIKCILKTDSVVRAVGYFSHVEKELSSRAMEAGLKEVLPRSKFVLELPQILVEMSSTESA